MITREQYIEGSERLRTARADVIARYRPDMPVVGPLTVRADWLEAPALIHNGTRLDQERLLAEFATIMVHHQKEIGSHA